MADKFIKGLTEKTTWVDDDWIVFQPDGESSVAYRIKRSNLTFILKSLFNAHTILQATTDNTPVAITIEEQRIIGRLTLGNIKGLTASETRTLLGLATTDSPQFAAVNVVKVENQSGILKIQPGANANAEFFGDTDVGDADVGKILFVRRRAVEGDDFISFYINSTRSALIEASGQISLVCSNISFDIAGFLRWRDTTDGFKTKIRVDLSPNTTFKQYGLITAASGDKYIQWQVDDATDKFILDREDSNILGFIVNMPLEVAGEAEFKSHAYGNTGANAVTSFTATPTFDFKADGNTQKMTLTGNVTTFATSNERGSANYDIWLVNDGTAGRTVAAPTGWTEIPGGDTHDTSANAINLYQFKTDPENTIKRYIIKNM